MPACYQFGLIWCQYDVMMQENNIAAEKGEADEEVDQPPGGDDGEEDGEKEDEEKNELDDDI